MAWLFAAAMVIVLLFLLCGNVLLVANDPPPGRVAGAVVLQGSVAGERARVAGAVHLLQQGLADRVLLSIPKESYWGQSISPVARTYLDRTYGDAIASRVDFCELSGAVDSTAQEMQALGPCIEDRHWRSIVIVTSNYHTRRAGMTWRKLTAQDPNVHVWIEGVDDPEFQRPWWRHRQSAKIFVTEFTKLMWTMVGGR
jgi:DUF218 domain-containing protein